MVIIFCFYLVSEIIGFLVLMGKVLIVFIWFLMLVKSFLGLYLVLILIFIEEEFLEEWLVICLIFLRFCIVFFMWIDIFFLIFLGVDFWSDILILIWLDLNDGNILSGICVEMLNKFVNKMLISNKFVVIWFFVN